MTEKMIEMGVRREATLKQQEYTWTKPYTDPKAHQNLTVACQAVTIKKVSSALSLLLW